MMNKYERVLLLTAVLTSSIISILALLHSYKRNSICEIRALARFKNDECDDMGSETDTSQLTSSNCTYVYRATVMVVDAEIIRHIYSQFDPSSSYRTCYYIDGSMIASWDRNAVDIDHGTTINSLIVILTINILLIIGIINRCLIDIRVAREKALMRECCVRGCDNSRHTRHHSDYQLIDDSDDSGTGDRIMIQRTPSLEDNLEKNYIRRRFSRFVKRGGRSRGVHSDVFEVGDVSDTESRVRDLEMQPISLRHDE